ncbi:helix-turn-helix domain-containing protein, partial [Salmonella enterica subsp. enterica serovar Infantis]
ERIIADALCITPQEIWPSRYDDIQIKNDAYIAE